MSENECIQGTSIRVTMGLKTGGWRRRWIIRLGRLNSSIIENLFETSIETNTVENAIPFDRFYPLLSTRYNLTVHRGISSYNHDRVRSVSLKWKIVRNGWLIATGFNGVEFTMLPVWGSCWKQTCRRQVMNQVFNSTLSIKKELFTIFISRISLKFTKTEFLKKFRILPRVFFYYPNNATVLTDNKCNRFRRNFGKYSRKW